MKEGHVYIYGEIIPWQDDEASTYGGVNMKDVTKQLQQNKESESLTVHINSPGGAVYEGFGILDIIRNEQKPTTVIIEGLCASIGTIIAMSGDTVKATENSTFMIHNPWTMTMGDAEFIEKEAAQLKQIENRLIDIYGKKTGLEQDEIRQLMKEETWMDAEQAKSKGFVDEVVIGAKVAAKLDKPKQDITDMKESEIKNEISSLRKMVNGLMDKFKSQPKDLIVQDVNGVEIEMPDIETLEQVDVGVTANIDGSPASGTHEVDGVGEITFVDGEITEITGAGADEEVEALKQENADLKQQLEEMQNSMAKREKNMKAELTAVNAKFEKLANAFSDDNQPPAQKGTDGNEQAPKKRVAFKK